MSRAWRRTWGSGARGWSGATGAAGAEATHSPAGHCENATVIASVPAWPRPSPRRQMVRGLAQPAPKSRDGVRRACGGMNGLMGRSARGGAAINPIKTGTISNWQRSDDSSA
jgi:hypothetical protein